MMSSAKGEGLMTYTKRVPAFAVLVFLAFGSTVDAQPANQSDTSASAWYQACKAFVERRLDANSVAFGNFCSGVVHGLAFVGPTLLPEMKFCAPPTSDANQLIRVVLQYVDAQPQRMHEDFRQLALEAFRNAWPGPCKSSG